MIIPFKMPVNSTSVLAVLAIFVITAACGGTRKSADQPSREVITTNVNGLGVSIKLDFLKGSSHNHPLMAVWLETTDGRYIETLYVAESIGTGVFRHADRSTGHWEAGPVRRPAALPYWAHQRGIQAPDGLFMPTPEQPVADAITGPTPDGDFTLASRATWNAPQQFKLMFEINQSWDWNEYWTNNKYPDSPEYKTSSQPAIVYSALIDLEKKQESYTLEPVGHSHYAGLDGSLNPDLSTITTALQITKSITVSVE